MPKKTPTADLWTFTAEDRAVARTLATRLPGQLFDAHAHLYEQAHIGPGIALIQSGPVTAGAGVWHRCLGQQLGAARLKHALCLPFPSRGGDAAAANRFLVKEVRRRKQLRGLVLAGPATPRAEIESLLEANPQIVGFKVYHFLAPRADTFQCEPSEYIPDWVWQLADARGLVILLHLVRDGALADRANQRYIRRCCQRFPQAKLVLAHAGRGFHAPNTARGVASLRGLTNVWFDTSAICEPDPIAAILDEFGPRRVLWGSDFPVSQQRGRCVTLGTGFAWITTDQVDWNQRAFFGRPVLVGLESTRALLDAADRLGLDSADLQDLFHDNAARLTGLLAESGTRTQDRYRTAKTLIPGGTQLLSKRPEMAAPDQWPAYFREARGCEVWDLDGRHYYDCGLHGIGATLLGFRDPEVTRAVQRRVALGSLCTLNPPEEVELAERLCAIHPWAQQARFTRTGGEAMAVAVRIARATTDRSAVAICGYHGWHDWYLAANLGETEALSGHLLPGLEPLGVPRELRGTAFTFAYNDRRQFDRILGEAGPRLAAVVMEPCRYRDPEPGFLEYVRERAHQVGAVLVFDEITIGWRLCFGGAHLRLGVQPDMAVFGKTLSNGHPMGAIIGTRQAMQGAHGSFISSSYWTDGVGPAAALATIEKLSRIDLPAHCQQTGARMQAAWRRHAATHRLPVTVDDGYPALARFAFEHPQAAALKTLYIQSLLDRGFLANTAIYVSLAHTPEIIGAYEDAVDEVFGEIATALQEGDVSARLRGPVAHSGFKRLV
ncbi:MAG TPA: aminotransferase class III-fold pyridoxal phosphate-dependent enzyme [Candidatus Anammoximicrobium sp.]|nr:aminotransferase class III-fold pyridoxal phosphate-dependent enzyme [Candidatus Anammoximicrobium sp.]